MQHKFHWLCQLTILLLWNALILSERPNLCSPVLRLKVFAKKLIFQLFLCMKETMQQGLKRKDLLKLSWLRFHSSFHSLCSCLFLSVPVCSCLFLSVSVCFCLFLSVSVCFCLYTNINIKIKMFFTCLLSKM